MSEKCIKKLEASTESRKIEDLNFLMNMKTTREGSIGSFDKKLVKTKKRKLQEDNYKALNVSKEPCCSSASFFEDRDDHADVNSSEEDINDVDYSDKTVDAQLRQVRKKQNLFIVDNKSESWKNNLCLVADKYKLSNRCATETAGIVLKSSGVDLSQISLSKTTISRKRKQVRKI